MKVPLSGGFINFEEFNELLQKWYHIDEEVKKDEHELEFLYFHSSQFHKHIDSVWDGQCE